jgi:hypothetical protein
MPQPPTPRPNPQRMDQMDDTDALIMEIIRNELRQGGGGVPSQAVRAIEQGEDAGDFLAGKHFDAQAREMPGVDPEQMMQERSMLPERMPKTTPPSPLMERIIREIWQQRREI